MSNGREKSKPKSKNLTHLLNTSIRGFGGNYWELGRPIQFQLRTRESIPFFPSPIKGPPATSIHYKTEHRLGLPLIFIVKAHNRSWVGSKRSPWSLPKTLSKSTYEVMTVIDWTRIKKGIFKLSPSPCKPRVRQ